MTDAEKSKTGRRRLARKVALAALFLYEAGDKMSPESAFDLFCKNFGPIEDQDLVLDCEASEFRRIMPFVKDLFFGVTSNREEIDRNLAAASEHWRLDRMSRVDRNVMRMALYEMLFRDDIPLKVSLNEAIDLGKDFGAEDSGAFINGILDRVHHSLTGEEAAPPAETGPLTEALEKRGSPKG